MLDHSFRVRVFVVVFEVEIGSHALIPRFKPGSVHIGSVSSFRWVKGVCVFRRNLPPALLAE